MAKAKTKDKVKSSAKAKALKKAPATAKKAEPTFKSRTFTR